MDYTDHIDRRLFLRLPPSPYGQEATRAVACKISQADFDYLFKSLFPFHGANDRLIALLLYKFVSQCRALNLRGWTQDIERAFHDLINNPESLTLTLPWKSSI